MADETIAYQKTGLIGGGNNLDGVDGRVLKDGDFAYIMLSGNIQYNYMLDAASAQAEKVPFIIKPDVNAGNKRWILQTPYIAYVDATAPDQGAATAEGYRSLKDLIDKIGITKRATIVCPSTGSGNTTPHTLTTNDTIPANISFRIEEGAVFDGTGTLTINGPFEHGLSQCFGSSITVSFGSKIDKVSAAWFGFDTAATGAVNKAAILAAINSCSSVYGATNLGGEVLLHRGIFTVAADLSITTRNVTLCGASPLLGYDGGVNPPTELSFEAGTSGLILGSGGAAAKYITIKNLMIEGNDLITNGVWISGQCSIKNVMAAHCVNGFHFASLCNTARLSYITAIYNSAYGVLSDSGDNTVMSIDHAQIRENDDVGLGITAGVGMSISHAVIESNSGVGLYIYNQAALANELHSFYRVWFENNDRTVQAAAGPDTNARITSFNLTTAEPALIHFDQCTFDASMKSSLDILAGNDISFSHCYGPIIKVAATAHNVTTTLDTYGILMQNSGDTTNYQGVRPQFIDLANPGAELCTNGAAWIGAAGATPPDDWQVGVAATHTIFDSGDGAPYDVCLKVEHNGVNNNPGPEYSFSTEIGGVYEISIAHKKIDAVSAMISVSSRAMAADLLAVLLADAVWTTHTYLITAKTITTYLFLGAQTAVATQHALFDTVSIKKIPAIYNGDLYAQGNIVIKEIPFYANNAAAIAGGLRVGAFYRVSVAVDPEPLYIVH